MGISTYKTSGPPKVFMRSVRESYSRGTAAFDSDLM